MAENKIFPTGFNVKTKKITFGEIIKIGINAEKFIEFLAQHTNDRGYVNIDIFRAKNTNNPYPVLNTFGENTEENSTKNYENSEEIMQFSDEEIPF